MIWRMKSRHEIVIAAVFTIGLLGFALVPSAESRQYPEPSAKKGETLYQTACSSCHGADGRGAPQYQVGFDVPLPDFTDCSFASREPDADWVAVAHQGGPVRGFSKLMPAFGKALSFEDLESIVSYIRNFCGNQDWPPGELNMPRSLVTEKAYPEDEAVYSLALDVEGQRAVSNKIVYEKRFAARNQFELTIPFGWKEQGGTEPGETPEESWLGGLGDLALGVKRAFFHNAGIGTIFSATGEIIVPTGDREKGYPCSL